MKPRLKFYFLFFCLLFLFFCSIQFSLAVETKKPTLQINIGSYLTSDSFQPYSGGDAKIEWASQYIAAVYKFGVGLAVILAVVMIMVGGFIWLMSAGSPDKVGKAKEFITSAMTGLLLALFSFLILQTVNPELLSLDGFNTGLPNVPAGGGGGTGGGGAGGGVPTGDISDFDPEALVLADKYVDDYGAQRTSAIRYDGTRHDPREPGYVGNVADFHYDPDPNNPLTSHILNSAVEVESLSWGTAYHQPDGSVWVKEPGGSTGYHWHAEFPADGWEWQPVRY